jgi:hypothetical protein
MFEFILLQLKFSAQILLALTAASVMCARRSIQIDDRVSTQAHKLDLALYVLISMYQEVSEWHIMCLTTVR